MTWPGQGFEIAVVLVPVEHCVDLVEAFGADAFVQVAFFKESLGIPQHLNGRGG